MAYFWAWVICGAATLVVIGCGLYLTRGLRPALLRDLIRLLCIATLVAPAGAGSHEGLYAPAYIVLAFEAFLQVDGDPIPALISLILAWSLALLIFLPLALWHWRAQSSRSPS